MWKMLKDWEPPDEWRVITTLDAHTAGEPLRVITGGLPKIRGNTILEKRRYVRENLDVLRKGLLWEPRGHADMYGAILTEPTTPDGDFGVIFLHNSGYSTMCGHGIIALAKATLDTGRIEKGTNQPVLKIDTPAGRVTATAHRENGTVKAVAFQNVPSFLFAEEQEVTVPEIGTIHCDVAFGGDFYAFCDAEEVGVELQLANYQQLIDLGKTIKKNVKENLKVEHPFKEDLSFLYGTIFVGPPADPSNHSRNVCIFADGQVDRCPTGTGVSARVAMHYAKGEVAKGESITIESILGTTFTVQVVETRNFGPYSAVIPQVTGKAYITGQNKFYFDPSDPLRQGFIFR